MKHCPNCNELRKVKTRYTIPKTDGVMRQINCLTCDVIFYTQEIESDKTTFLLARKDKNV